MLGTIQGVGVFLCFFLGFKGLVNAVHIVILTVPPLWNGVIPYDKRVSKRIGSLLYGISWCCLNGYNRHSFLFSKLLKVFQNLRIHDHSN